jgi:hypothetical protein
VNTTALAFDTEGVGAEFAAKEMPEIPTDIATTVTAIIFLISFSP